MNTIITILTSDIHKHFFEKKIVLFSMNRQKNPEGESFAQYLTLILKPREGLYITIPNSYSIPCSFYRPLRVARPSLSLARCPPASSLPCDS